MTEIRNKTGGRPAKNRIDKQKRVVSTKLTELQYYAIKKRAGESGLPTSTSLHTVPMQEGLRSWLWSL